MPGSFGTGLHHGQHGCWPASVCIEPIWRPNSRSSQTVVHDRASGRWAERSTVRFRGSYLIAPRGAGKQWVQIPRDEKSGCTLLLRRRATRWLQQARWPH